MAAPTQLLPSRLVRDLAVTLARLRLAREVGDRDAMTTSETKLNELCDMLPRPRR